MCTALPVKVSSVMRAQRVPVPAGACCEDLRSSSVDPPSAIFACGEAQRRSRRGDFKPCGRNAATLLSIRHITPSASQLSLRLAMSMSSAPVPERRNAHVSRGLTAFSARAGTATFDPSRALRNSRHAPMRSRRRSSRRWVVCERLPPGRGACRERDDRRTSDLGGVAPTAPR